MSQKWRLEHLFYAKKAEVIGNVQPGDEKAWGDRINIYKYLKGRCKENEKKIFNKAAIYRNIDYLINIFAQTVF